MKRVYKNFYRNFTAAASFMLIMILIFNLPNINMSAFVDQLFNNAAVENELDEDDLNSYVDNSDYPIIDSEDYEYVLILEDLESIEHDNEYNEHDDNPPKHIESSDEIDETIEQTDEEAQLNSDENTESEHNENINNNQDEQYSQSKTVAINQVSNLN